MRQPSFLEIIAQSASILRQIGFNLYLKRTRRARHGFTFFGLSKRSLVSRE